MSNVTIQKRGKYYQSKFETAKIDGKRKFASKSGFRTKAEAEKEGIKAYNEYMNTGHDFTPSDMSYSDLLDYWLEKHCYINLKYHTIEAYSSIAKNHIKPNIGHYKISQITRSTLQDFINKMYVDKSFSKNFLNNIKKVIKGSFTFAYENDFIKVNPAIGIKLPKYDIPPEDPAHILTNEEINLILNRFKNNHCVYYAFLTAYCTGLRIAEVFALTWNDIDFRNKTISVNKNILKKNQVGATKKRHISGNSTTVWYFGTCKTQTSYRTIPIGETLCSEGLTILEFDVKLSDADKEKFCLGQSIYNEEYGKQMEKVKEEAKAEYKKKIKLDKLREQHSDYSISKLDEESQNTEISDEELINSNYGKEYEYRIKMYDKAIEQRKNSKITLGLALNVDQKGGTFNYDKFNPNMDWYASIYIDNEPYYVKNRQKAVKIADNEYKIYTMYFINDSELKDKDNFKITLKNNKLVNVIYWQNISLDDSKDFDKAIEGWNSDCHYFAKTIKEGEDYSIDLDGEYEVNVSKTQLLEDSKVIENPNIKSEFRNITHSVEKVVVSPIQTVITVKKTATQQSSNAYAGRYTDHNIEHLPLTRKYLIYDDKGNYISSFPVSNKNTLIYSNGTREDYDVHDIPNKSYSNATWEKVQYILIENTDTSYIKIVPVEIIRNPINEEEYTGEEIDYEMGPMIINIK